MAAKPIERFVKKQIAEQGGWDRILERIASGETISAISQTFYWPGPERKAISFAFFSRLLHQDPARKPAIAEAKRLRAEAWADQALARSDDTPMDRDAVAKAKLVIETRLRLAGLADREQYGEQKQAVNVSVNVADVHLGALRHRFVEVSQPLGLGLAEAQGAAQTAAASLTGACGNDAGADSTAEAAPKEPVGLAVGTQNVQSSTELRESA